MTEVFLPGDPSFFSRFTNWFRNLKAPRESTKPEIPNLHEKYKKTWAGFEQDWDGQIKTQEFPEPVTRANWNSVLIKSFYASRGSLTKHIAYFEWLKSRTNFDYKPVLEAFTYTGCWNLLTEEEKGVLASAYLRVTSHFSPGNEEDFFEDALYAQLSGMDDYWTRDAEIAELQTFFDAFVKRYGPLEQMDERQFTINLVQIDAKELLGSD